jgi:hypothetical protein
MAQVHQRIIAQSMHVGVNTDVEISADSEVGKALAEGYIITQISQSVVPDVYADTYRGSRNGVMYALFVLERTDTRGEDLFGAA